VQTNKIAIASLVAFLVTVTSLVYGQESSQSDLAKAAQNPVSDLISLPFQNNTNFNVGPYDKTQNILNSIEDGFFEVDLAGNFTSYNGSLCKIVGYSREELKGMNYRVYSKENSDKVFSAFNRVYKTGESVKEFDWEIVTKNGEKRYVEASISLIRNSGTEARGFRGIVRDITERKATEEKIKEMLHAFGKIWTK